MKTTKDKIITYCLTPLSWIYGGVTIMRNWLFDHHVLKEESFDIPVISVGNISVGGTGKTPHVEYLLSNLCSDYRIGVLSRGYKRKTKGYILANSKSTPETIGDEPYQMYCKYGIRVKVAVCEKRREGIRRLMADHPEINLIVLDDAFQHRYVKPAISLMLMDYNRPVYNDRLLPLGRLRETAHGINRADVVVVTKCPDNLTPLDYRLVSNSLQLMAYQKLFFTRYEYGGLMPVFPDDDPYSASLSYLTSKDTALLLTGIAQPRSFVRFFKKFPFRVTVSHFSDHHDFSRKDIEEIARKFDEMKGERKIIVTTEKDAVRLSNNPYFPEALKPFCFYLPIAVSPAGGMDSGSLMDEIRKLIYNFSAKTSQNDNSSPS